MAIISPKLPPARGVKERHVGYKNIVFVRPGEDLAAKYDWLKSASRDAQMGALSATNRRVLVLTPGKYEPASEWELDTDYVDVTTLTPLDPRATLVTSAREDPVTVPSTVKQTADDVRLSGFTIENTATTANDNGVGFGIAASDNSASVYEHMHFLLTTAGGSTSIHKWPVGCVITDGVLDGSWYFCESGNRGWRVRNDTGQLSTFRPYMFHCKAGTGSFCGDGYGKVQITSCEMYHCEAGMFSYASCSGMGAEITSDAYFENCIGGDKCWAQGCPCAGTFVHCRGGSICFGGSQGKVYGSFTGVAIDCEASGDSFGAGWSDSRCTGRLERCRITGIGDAMFCNGAILKDCYIQVTGTNKHCIDLSSDAGTTKIYDSTLIANGSGDSIYAGGAKNVIAAHCRLNKAINANVTNLIATPYNVIDSDIG
jgi:hypothetical protein